MSANDRLLAAMGRILTPLVRILLRRGVPSDAVTELVRKTYVDVAERDFELDGKRQTLSRISVLTGLNRKEVSRLLKRGDEGPESDDRERNRAAAVLGAWLRDEEFLDRKHDPLPLAFAGDSPSFQDLVRKHSGDMKPRAIADELLRVGAIEEIDGRYRMTARGYVPAAAPEHLIDVLGTDSAELIGTIEHNIESADDPMYQRKVLYDNVPAEYVDEFRAHSARLSQHLLEELDRWLAERDRGDETNGDDNDGGRVTLGLGAYQIVRWNRGEMNEDD